MVILNEVTKKEVKMLFCSTCERLMNQNVNEEQTTHYYRLIEECRNYPNFNVLANLCYLLRTHPNQLAEETEKFLRLMGGA